MISMVSGYCRTMNLNYDVNDLTDYYIHGNKTLKLQSYWLAFNCLEFIHGLILSEREIVGERQKVGSPVNGICLLIPIFNKIIKAIANAKDLIKHIVKETSAL